MDAMEKYFKGLTEAEGKEHIRIEAELNAIVREGISKPCAAAFVLATVAIRKIEPKAPIEGIFEEALLSGLDVTLDILREGTKPARKSAPKRTRSGVRLVT